MNEMNIRSIIDFSIDLFFITTFSFVNGWAKSGGGSPELDGFYLTKWVDFIVFLVSFLRLSWAFLCPSRVLIGSTKLYHIPYPCRPCAGTVF